MNASVYLKGCQCQLWKELLLGGNCCSWLDLRLKGGKSYSGRKVKNGHIKYGILDWTLCWILC